MLLYIVALLYIIIYSDAILCASVRVLAPPWGRVRVRAFIYARGRARGRVGAWAARGSRCEPLSRSEAARSAGKGPRARRGHNPALSCPQALSGPLRGAQQ